MVCAGRLMLAINTQVALLLRKDGSQSLTSGGVQDTAEEDGSHSHSHQEKCRTQQRKEAPGRAELGIKSSILLQVKNQF